MNLKILKWPPRKGHSTRKAATRNRIVKITQNRLLEKMFLQSIGCKIASFAEVKSQKELPQATEKIGFPCVLKLFKVDTMEKDKSS